MDIEKLVIDKNSEVFNLDEYKKDIEEPILICDEKISRNEKNIIVYDSNSVLKVGGKIMFALASGTAGATIGMVVVYIAIFVLLSFN